jgi:hypothetical protein
MVEEDLMNSKKLALYILITIFAFQSIYCINIETLDLITAQPQEIVQAIKPHTIKLLAAKALETGLANIPLANLKELLAHEQLAAKIVTRMNYINDITRENVDLLIRPIADNFDHVNQHTLEWILYLKPDDIEPIIPIITEANDYYGKQLLTKLIEHNPQVQKALDNYHFKCKIKEDLEAMGIIIASSAVGCLLLGAALKFIIIPAMKYQLLARLKSVGPNIMWPDVPGLKPLNVLWTLYNKKP